MLSVEAVIALGVFLGCLARTLLPYLQKLKAEPTLKFDPKYLVTFIVALVESGIATLLLFGAVPSELFTAPISRFLVFVTAFSWAYTSNDVLNKYVA